MLSTFRMILQWIHKQVLFEWIKINYYTIYIESDLHH